MVAELDHLVFRQGGAVAARALREDFELGAYIVEWWPSAIRETIAVANRYESMQIGLTDASLIALAARLKTAEIATLDERHFRTARSMDSDDAFTLLPYDSH